MKKYMDVIRHGKSSTHLTIEGAIDVVCQEKLDGANASFTVEEGELKLYSRNTEVDEHNTLRGYYGWAVEHLTPFVDQLDDRLVFFGEWLVQHKIQYMPDAMYQFYLFDIYDKEQGKYLPYENVLLASKELNLNLVPVFYKGPFQSIEHIQSFVGQSKLGPKGEGVVVKNTHYSDKHGNQQFTKFVSKEFTEVMQTKEHVIKAPVNELQVFAEQTVTKARVEKLLHKLVDEGHLAEDFAIENMKDILKHMGPRLFDDVVKEELDVLLKMLKGRIGRLAPTIVKEVLNEMGRM